jgi:DNA-binding response OmpR family regulator
MDCIREDSMSSRKLLLVEVDPQVAGAYELFLSGRGYKVTPVSTVGAAMRAAAASPPHAVIVGSLPDDVDRGTVVARLRVIAAPHPLSVIVLSPSMDEVVGADIVIPMGAHPRALLDGLRSVLRRHGTTQPLATVS